MKGSMREKRPGYWKLRVGSGDSVEAVQEAYDLTRDQVLTAVRYAAHVAAHLPPAVEDVS